LKTTQVTDDSEIELISGLVAQHQEWQVAGHEIFVGSEMLRVLKGNDL
jgi:hypothetical protein